MCSRFESKNAMPEGLWPVDRTHLHAIVITHPESGSDIVEAMIELMEGLWGMTVNPIHPQKVNQDFVGFVRLKCPENFVS